MAEAWNGNPEAGSAFFQHIPRAPFRAIFFASGTGAGMMSLQEAVRVDYAPLDAALFVSSPLGPVTPPVYVRGHTRPHTGRDGASGGRVA